MKEVFAKNSRSANASDQMVVPRLGFEGRYLPTQLGMCGKRRIFARLSREPYNLVIARTCVLPTLSLI